VSLFVVDQAFAKSSMEGELLVVPRVTTGAANTGNNAGGGQVDTTGAGGFGSIAAAASRLIAAHSCARRSMDTADIAPPLAGCGGGGVPT
jgi:hypothetical protein